ncbi:MAG TPA: hypothetical protein VM783_03465, partial [Candidatus Acidoferrum sp.]|nr:hypothetical protein [Candidatus Acidoferrum sp.]
EIVIGDRCENRLFAPDCQYLEDSARDKERNWKMNDDWMLRVPSEERGLQIEGIRGMGVREK